MKKFSCILEACLSLGLFGCGPKDNPEPTPVETVSVTGISISASSLSLFEGERAELTAAVSPSNATNGLVSWSSSAPGVATVSAGTVLAVSAGVAVVTATSRDGGFTASCTVTVSAYSVRTVEAAFVGEHAAVLGGRVFVAAADAAGVHAGIRYGREASLDGAVSVEAASIGSDLSFSVPVEGLEAASTYYFQAYATVYGKALSGEVLSFTTEAVPVSGLGLSASALTLPVGGSPVQLGVTVSPEDATAPELSWSTSNASVATVSDGMVTPVGVGKATVTVRCGEVSASCEITVCEMAAVDLGLGVKWANMNVGAAVPSEAGSYFAWGETAPKTNYNWGSYTFREAEGQTVLPLEHDAASAILGGSWRMPTLAEMQELISHCSWTWASEDGVPGYRVTGPSGAHIFLPAAGYWHYNSRTSIDLYGCYWTSSIHAGSSTHASYLNLSASICETGYIERYYGFPVRAVCE